MPLPTVSTDPKSLQAQQAAFAKTAANQAAVRQAAPIANRPSGAGMFRDQPLQSAHAYAPTAANSAQAANYQTAMAKMSPFSQVAKQMAPPVAMQRPGMQPGLLPGPQAVAMPSPAASAGQAAANVQSQPGMSAAPSPQPAAVTHGLVVAPNQAAQANVQAPSSQAATTNQSGQAAAQAAAQADAIARNKALNGAS